MTRYIVAIGYGVLVWVGMGLSCHASELNIQHHDLVVELDPSTHTIAAQDTIQLVGLPKDDSVIHLSLNPDLEIEEVFVGGGPLEYWEEALHTSKRHQGSDEISVTRTVEIRLPSLPDNREALSLRILYRGEINDPPRAAPSLRFVRPDKTMGHIGEEGVYLTSETSWYPDVPGSLATFHVTVTLPNDWRAVTHGREMSYEQQGQTSIAEWRTQANTEALTLAANRFVKQKRAWQGIELATYLFPEDDHLASQYLDAIARYLDVYTEILGPYPFPQFAVVENFFPSGLGLPSFTLLGSGVIKRGYTQPYSLGHEIVHSWIGNSVLNRLETGNWVEGLTTYLANYYYEERFDGQKKAVAHRRRMMVEYSLYSQPDDDYAVVKFHHKENRLDNAIGYQKTAMIFHMLRKQIGDRAFFQGVRQLVAEYTGGYAGWPQLQRVFEDTARTDLSWFFTQWVERPGAPMLAIQEAQVQPDEREGFWIRLRMSQTGTAYRLQVPVSIQLDHAEDYHAMLDLRATNQLMSVWVPTKPLRLTIDPDFEAFRRLTRAQISPMLNLWVTDQQRAVSVPTVEGDQAVFQAALDRIRSQEDDVVWMEGSDGTKKPQSVLAFGGPRQNAVTAEVLRWCGSRVTLHDQEITIEGETFSGEHTAVLLSCANPKDPDHVGTVFFGLTSEAAKPVARLLFFYGWDSYLVYQHGKVVARGSFVPEAQELTVDLGPVEP
ncbi:MAG: M1 family aminopeptidase [Nitrospirae bacterium]|nr:M1 family aminopeptidase [Nitrospirota bacterium]